MLVRVDRSIVSFNASEYMHNASVFESQYKRSSKSQHDSFNTNSLLPYQHIHHFPLSTSNHLPYIPQIHLAIHASSEASASASNFALATLPQNTVGPRQY